MGAINAVLGWLDDMPRALKRGLMFGYDFAAVAAAWMLAYVARIATTEGAFEENWVAVVGLTGIGTLVAFRMLGLHHELLRFAGVRSVRALAFGSMASGAILLATCFVLRYNAPRTLPLIYALVLFAVSGAPRLAVRLMQMSVERRDGEPVAIYGAGAGGRQLAAWLRRNPSYRVECFVDDDPKLQGHYVLDVKVRSPEVLASLARTGRCRRALLAIPSLPLERRREIVAFMETIGLQVHTVPHFEELVEGRAHIGEFRELDVEDLLPRPLIQPDESLMDSAVRGKRVLVTGAGGSIGSELCRQILQRHPASLTLVDHGEYNLYAIDAELSGRAKQHGDAPPRAVLGSVLDRGLVEDLFEQAKPQIVFHAAAYKHVPLVEANAVEGVRNNVLGTRIVAEAAERTGVEHFILVSTDKAVRPTNVMGASKRMAELVLHMLARRGSRTIFSMVRFGNVLGSSGSVVPLFRRQIALGGPVTVTHPDVTRFFMTIREASQLVVQSVPLAHGGEVFILDMGQPVRIADLARRMIHLSGKRPKTPDGDGDIAIEYTGLRPGEKLYEELLIGEAASGTAHPLILRAREEGIRDQELRGLLVELDAACDRHDAAEVRHLLVRAGTGLVAGGAPPDNVYRLPQADADVA
jgi:FlaA1/EpsC-like NDP-sugar epimerase